MLIVGSMNAHSTSCARSDGNQVGAVDCSQQTSVCSKYGVEGYPTILLFPHKDHEHRETYKGERKAEGTALITSSSRYGHFLYSLIDSSDLHTWDHSVCGVRFVAFAQLRSHSERQQHRQVDSAQSRSTARAALHVQDRTVAAVQVDCAAIRGTVAMLDVCNPSILDCGIVQSACVEPDSLWYVSLLLGQSVVRYRASDAEANDHAICSHQVPSAGAEIARYERVYIDGTSFEQQVPSIVSYVSTQMTPRNSTSSTTKERSVQTMTISCVPL
jgi:hypothetical protein